MRDERGDRVEGGHVRADVIFVVVMGSEAELDGGVGLAPALDEADYPQVEVDAAGSARRNAPDQIVGKEKPDPALYTYRVRWG